MKDSASERDQSPRTSRFVLNKVTGVFEEQKRERRTRERKRKLLRREAPDQFLQPTFNEHYIELGEFGYAGTFEIRAKDGKLAGYLDTVTLSEHPGVNETPVILAYMSVHYRYKNQGYADRLLQAFNAIIQRTPQTFAILDNIIPVTDPAHDMYTHAGWKQVENTNIFTYNLSAQIPQEQLKHLLGSPAALAYTSRTLATDRYK